MESQIESQNKAMLRRLVDGMPREYKYAERVSAHMKRRKKIIVSTQTVYRVANGKTQNPEIAWVICVAYRAYRIAQLSLNKQLTKLTEA